MAHGSHILALCMLSHEGLVVLQGERQVRTRLRLGDTWCQAQVPLICKLGGLTSHSPPLLLFFFFFGMHCVYFWPGLIFVISLQCLKIRKLGLGGMPQVVKA
jgi:hypothetical protein